MNFEVLALYAVRQAHKPFLRRAVERFDIDIRVLEIESLPELRVGLRLESEIYNAVSGNIGCDRGYFHNLPFISNAVFLSYFEERAPLLRRVRL